MSPLQSRTIQHTHSIDDEARMPSSNSNSHTGVGSKPWHMFQPKLIVERLFFLSGWTISVNSQTNPPTEAIQMTDNCREQKEKFVLR